MSVYVDASFLVALFVNQRPLSARASTFLEDALPELVVSDFAAAEFASAIARLVRMRSLTTRQAAGMFADFDAWTSRVAARAETTPADISAAAANLRRMTLNLRTPDAINIAIAQRVQATLATFDISMAKSAASLGLQVVAL